MVKENPLELEIKTKKFAHLVQGDHTCEKTKNPLTRVHLSLYVVELKMSGKTWQMTLNQDFNYAAVLVQAGKSGQVDVPHITVFYQAHKKPESHRFRAMNQKLPHNKIHSLDVIDLAFIVSKGSENPLKRPHSLRDAILRHKVRVFGERAT